MAAITLADIRLALAGLNGESSVPNDTARDYHINRIVEDIYYRFPWSWRKTTATLTFTAGVATLPADFTTDSFPFSEVDNSLTPKATLLDSSGVSYTRIEPEDRFIYGASDKVFYVSGNNVDGYTATLLDTAITSLSMTYFKGHDVLSTGTSTTRIPLITPIATGAFMYFVRKQDIDRNINQERAEYEVEIRKLYALEGGNRHNKLISKSEKTGHSIGGI